FFFQAEDGIRDYKVTGVQTCALPIFASCPASEIESVVVSVAALARSSGDALPSLGSGGVFATCERSISAGDIQKPDQVVIDRHRSEERRVGKECRCRWARDDEKKKI